MQLPNLDSSSRTAHAGGSLPLHDEATGSESRLSTGGDSALLNHYADDAREAPDWQTLRVPLQRVPAHEPASLFRYRFIKRLLDLLVVALALPVLLPALIVVGAVVKFTSPGPVFFSHRRICRQGAFFSMWKFRTMCENSSEVLEHYLATRPAARDEWNRTHKLREDPRISSVGLFLRRFSLDELPQVWNVVTGRMSLVGPRPIVAAEVEKYGRFFDYYIRVKPGVTGLWQVSGRSKLSYDARVKLDCDYVERWSLFRDARILLATIKSVVNRDGAY